MYLPDHFNMADADDVRTMINAVPLAVLASHPGGALRADHLPLIMTKSKLNGHIAIANDLHETLGDDQPVLAIFQGPDAYISPNSYPSKADTHEVVPTWNYEVIHVHGRIRFHHDRRPKHGAVGMLTKLMETRTNGDAAWRMSDAPDAFMDEKLSQIVGLEIEILEIRAKSKLSQNKSDADRLDAADRRGANPIADRIRDV